MAQDLTYDANAFAPETGGRVHRGSFRVEPEHVIFEAEAAKVMLPIAGLRLRRGGHNGEQLFVEHPDFGGWSIYSADPRLNNDPILSTNPVFSRELQLLARSRRSIPPTVLAGMIAAGLLIAAMVFLWVMKDRIVKYLADKIPTAWEEKIGDQVFQGIAAEGKIVTNSPWSAPLQTITRRLEAAAPSSGYNFRFHVLQDTNVNAFAIPGGHIVILTGLLEAADTPEEVAGVLAHEMAHVTRRHSVRNLLKSAGLVILIQAALGDASGLLAIAAEGSRHLLQQKFSRDFEREADNVGWTYLAAARIDPRGLIHFFEKLKESAAQSPGAAMERSFALLNTHPTSQERIDGLKAKWEEQPNKGGFTTLGPWKKT